MSDKRTNPRSGRLQGRGIREFHTARTADRPYDTAATSREWTEDEGTLHYFSAGLAISAMAAYLLTDADGSRGEISLWGQILFEGVLAALLTILTRRFHGVLAGHPAITPVLILVPLLSLLWEPIQRLVFASGRPFEMMLMHSQKNLMLALAILGLNISAQRMSLFIGVVLCVFCAAVTRDHRVYWLVAGYGFCAVSWVMLGHWNGLRSRMLREQSRRLPLRWFLAGPAIAMLAAAATTAGGRSDLTALRGFLPGSGGDGEYDEFSRGGVNDGDSLVAGQDDIRSFGPIDQAPMADSEKPSLYDVINDQFDEPLRKNRTTQSAVALPPDMMATIRQRLSTVSHAGREFSTLRKKSASQQKRAAAISGTALLYVSGRVPVYLRTEVYDTFDGLTWYAAAPPADPLQLSFVHIGGKPWLQIPVRANVAEFDLYADTHAIKPINLKSPTIPAPAGTRFVHIEHVERVDLFSWKCDSLLQMNRDSLPELVPIHFRSEVPDPDELRARKSVPFSSARTTQESTLPTGPELDQIRELARSWTTGIPRGFGQMDAICARLQQEYRLDRTVQMTDGDMLPVSEFLFRTRSGPEYLFATAAAVMMRSLGYSTRLISGFYARPERYDTRGRHTAVLGSDAHFWCEVLIGAGTWATMEPSPGYVVPGRPPGRLQWLWSSLLSVIQTCRAFWPAYPAGCLATVVVFLFRGELSIRLRTLSWQWFPESSQRGRILQTARLLDHRLRIAGIPRPQHMTLSRWLAQFPELQSPLRHQFLHLAERAAFSENDKTQSDASVRQLCLAIQQQFPLALLRSASRSQRQSTSPSPASWRSEMQRSRGSSPVSGAESADLERRVQTRTTVSRRRRPEQTAMSAQVPALTDTAAADCSEQSAAAASVASRIFLKGS